MANEQGSRIIVIGASAGGVPALTELVSALTAGLDAAVFVVLHLWASAESMLPQILSRAAALPAEHASDGAPFEPGRIYVAPPDRHLLFHDGLLRVARGPQENRHRPSIDVLFRSAAKEHGPRVIGVLLTGADDDGTAGLLAIRQHGGVTIVQDPHDSQHPEMPQAALRAMDPDFTLALREIGPVLSDLVQGRPERKAKHAKTNQKHAKTNHMEEPTAPAEGLPQDVSALGTPTAFSCPDCGGTLWELQSGKLLRYRCRVGHAYSAGAMAEAQAAAVERALWSAVRALEESASISRRIAHKTEVLREDLSRKAEEREAHARVIRELLRSGGE